MLEPLSINRGQRMSVKISDFTPPEQRLLRAAFHALVPCVLIGGLDLGDPRVISVGHAKGLAAVQGSVDGSRIYAMVRIRGVDKSPEEVRIAIEQRASRAVPQQSAA
jgi:hypothetical protein